MGLFELLPFFKFNPINIINDSITGVIMAIKVVIFGIIDGLTQSKSVQMDVMTLVWIIWF